MARGLVESHSRPAPSAKVPVRLSLRRLATLIVPLAAVEWIAYPLVLHDSSKWWLSYIAYLALGVILPGTLLTQAFVRWRADWLTWIGIGWAVGHALEVISILATKTVGLPRLFLIWIPIAYLLVWRKKQWEGHVTAVNHPVQCAILLGIVTALASTTFVVLNIEELSPQPSYQSDVWFHINEAHEFRDHLDTSDPRIAGRPYAYHTLEYGPSVGANLAVQVPLANLVTRYSGLGSVWLLVFLLFNSGRQLRSHIAGFLAATMIVAPLDVFSLISSKLSFGSSIILFGVDLSTSTLVGFGALAGIFLPLRWYFRDGRVRDLWVIALLAYMAAGSKSVPGPLLLVAAAAVVAVPILQRHRPSTRPVLLASVFAVIFCITTLPIVLRATIADSATLTFASTARFNPYVQHLDQLPDWLRLAIYPIGLCLLLWVGVGFGTWRLAKGGDRQFCWFASTALAVGTVIAQAISLPGHSELFFLYMAMVLVAPVAGLGLCHLGRLLWRGRRRVTPLAALATISAVVALHVSVGGPMSAPLYDGSIWARALRNRIDQEIQAYHDPALPSKPTSYHDVSLLLRLTPGVLRGLNWLRTSAGSPATVIATNVPGAAMYAALCECREYFQTNEYAPEFIQAARTHTVDTSFADREARLRSWMSGDPGSVEALRRLGISYLIVDHVNGLPINGRDMPPASFSDADIAIYKL